MSFFERAQQSREAQQGRRRFVSPMHSSAARKIKGSLQHNPSSIGMLSEREVFTAQAIRPNLSLQPSQPREPHLCNQQMRLCLHLELCVLLLSLHQQNPSTNYPICPKKQEDTSAWVTHTREKQFLYTGSNEVPTLSLPSSCRSFICGNILTETSDKQPKTLLGSSFNSHRRL